ncbi:hypothetical protein MIND_00099300 [Mycena indigotica]|uniref:Uncharacterized protein n=1 Tax=Mycena indigotica TaxID=2126181 RepID=A0A8H6TEC2_9AGAR|nr:uncharacterized protein MIND_00099300 [Mycena indigotica]KAF7315831.1 hypothetical protein MIND_00099300 [Mycena indigotica]
MATVGADSSNPYTLVPARHPLNGVTVSPTASTSSTANPNTVSSLFSTASNLAASSSGVSSNANPNAFKAPAHKHAHHLHSIPPREKSTRTLIVDYMLWVHGRTRFAQARAELGMTDRTGGAGTPQYAHRQRPENYEEEDDVGSDGEDPVTLKARAGDPGRPHNDDEDERLRSQDLSLARALRLRAEGVEKVITSMLEQAPPPHPVPSEELLTPPTSPRIQPTGGKNLGPHALPNGVRLRLSLGTMINDLFARQAPVQPHRHRKQTSASPAAPVSTPSATADPGLPDALKNIATISASCPDEPNVQPWTVSSSTLRPGPGPLYPVQPRLPPSASARTRALYNAGADPSTANSPPAFRCPRHLHTGCEICVEAKSTPRGSNRGRASSFGDSNGAGRTQYWKGMPGGVSPEGGGITGWQDGSGIGSGLLRPKSTGTVLRRKTKDTFDGPDGSTTQNGAGNTKLSELIPRFIRLSAMVAAEMGREARGEEEEPAVEEREDGDEDSPMSVAERQDWEGAPPTDLEPLPPPATPVPSDSPDESKTAMYASALLPSREWYLLLAGLLTRAVLEGYLTAGWQGPDAVDCLLKVGLGKQTPREDGDEFEEFDPDELPSLLDATRLLFPALRDGNKEVKGQAEEEYENEMETRLRRFYDIPLSTPDLSTHMEDLAWQYPAEPVERAAVRFCEAIEKWRGKPELETYKKKPPPSSSPVVLLDTPNSAMESIQSPATTATPSIGPTAAAKLVRSTRKPSIQVYFPTFPMPRVGSGWSHHAGPAKRLRSPEPETAQDRPTKVPRGG